MRWTIVALGLPLLAGLAPSGATTPLSRIDAPSPGRDAAPADSSRFPRFDRVLLLETTAETSANVSIGDLNGDGRLDIVLAKGRHWPLVNRVLLAEGQGRFGPGRDLGTVSDRSYTGLLVDLDRDGDLDVVISNDRPDPGMVYLNDGTGHFRAGGSYGRAEWSTRNASVADLNGDGLPDIIVANRTGPNPGASYICLNQGGGRFGADCIQFSSESATTITPADLNGDGLIDLVVPHRDGGQGRIYLHGPRPDTVAFTPIPFGPPSASVRISAVADFDGDGEMDIVTSDEANGVLVHYGEGGARFGAGVPLGAPGQAPYALVVGDVNLDGGIDVVVGYIEAPSTVFFNLGTDRRFTPVSFGDGAGSVYGLAIGDLDADGRPDIAVARSEAPNVVYFADQGLPPTH